MNEVEATPFYGGRADDDHEDAPLSLLSQGDSLPLSYRSDNGTRESEFFVGDEQEKVNPYYDVVRRLSPTELIGRFMRTASPRVRPGRGTSVRIYRRMEGGHNEFYVRKYQQVYVACVGIAVCTTAAIAAALVLDLSQGPTAVVVVLLHL